MAVIVIVPSLHMPVVGAVLVVERANIGGVIFVLFTQVAMVSLLAIIFVFILVPLIINSPKSVPLPTKLILSKLQLIFWNENKSKDAPAT